MIVQVSLTVACVSFAIEAGVQVIVYVPLLFSVTDEYGTDGCAPVGSHWLSETLFWVE